MSREPSSSTPAIGSWKNSRNRRSPSSPSSSQATDGYGRLAIPVRLVSKNGRGGRIRTGGPLRPRQVRYQAALRPDLQRSYQNVTRRRRIRRRRACSRAKKAKWATESLKALHESRIHVHESRVHVV